jgi:hypothetical protein
MAEVVSSYDPDHEGIGRFLRSQDMQDMVRGVAELIRDRAIGLSPVGNPAEDEHAGRYIASWHVRVHDRGGATGDRAEAEVYNDSPEAFWVEFGHRGREPYSVLRRAAYEVRV